MSDVAEGPERKDRAASPEKTTGDDDERERERDPEPVDEKPAADAAPTAESSAAPPAAAASADTGDAAAQGQISNEEIADILDRREQARRAHDFMTADQLREELRGRGISIDDRTKMWNAEDGRKGMIGAAAPVTDGIQDDELNRLLEEREAARRQKDYSEADRIRDELKQKGVTLDDRTRVWQSIDGRRGMIGGGPMAGGMGGGTGGYGGGGTGPPSDMELQQLLDKREEARRGRDYDTADRIRDDLRMRGIRLDDRSKTWQSNDGRNGTFDGSGGGGFGGGYGGGGGGYGGGGYGGGGYGGMGGGGYGAYRNDGTRGDNRHRPY